MPDYSKAKIYKLHILGNEELIYYGSTTTKLSDRIAKHRAQFKRWKNGKSSNYYTSFKLFENENVVITLVEKYACSCKYELEAKERWWIENNVCINKCIPTRTKKEYEKSDKRKQYLKEYRKTDKYKQYIKEWYKTNADELKQKAKEYRIKNKEKIKQYQKEYEKLDKRKQYKKEYQKTDKYKEKIKCEFCSASVGKYGLKRHQRSIKCKSFQNNI